MTSSGNQRILERVERDHRAVAEALAQVAGEGRDPALAGRVSTHKSDPQPIIRSTHPWTLENWICSSLPVYPPGSLLRRQTTQTCLCRELRRE